MKSIGTLPIETERLLLRRMLRSDAEDIYETFASDPMVTRYLSWKAHSSIAVTRAYVSSILKALKG
jgi:ribosomal-protein-alanine N-acetyltransferase